MKKIPHTLFLCAAFVLPLSAQVVVTEPPVKPDPSAKYLFYFHGMWLENNPLDAAHPHNGTFEYAKIKETFRSSGFTVISEQRPKGTDAEVYASKIVSQIRRLIAHGVAPNKITVVGGSKGSYIAQFVSTQLQNRYVNYSILAGCNEASADKPSIHLSGNVLSVYEASDTLGQSCQYLKDSANALGEFKEIKVELGVKHKIVFQPYPEWVNPTIEWANQFASQTLLVPETRLSPKVLSEQVRNRNAYLIDVRTQDEYLQGHLQNASLIDFKAADFQANIQKLPKDKPVYLYCRSGNRSGKAKALLTQWGFKEVYNIGGFQDLAGEGLPVASK